MTDDEKDVLRTATLLLEAATCNSMNPDTRARWKLLRDRVTDELRHLSEA